ncbi:hypothetical protein CHARACLAT_010278 [Characodon lateralis]|uniref:Uncharacterized protein n=1 Tax=Characodon lateralis TaxID=208331 RepID=A0ABU7DFB6_9TELE|nr:hypothetical protein [Characodon lateralis]
MTRNERPKIHKDRKCREYDENNERMKDEKGMELGCAHNKGETEVRVQGRKKGTNEGPVSAFPCTVKKGRTQKKERKEIHKGEGMEKGRTNKSNDGEYNIQTTAQEIKSENTKKSICIQTWKTSKSNCIFFQTV